MTPPGLTCIDCEHPLYPEIACITSSGWRHLHCPEAGEETCNTCAATLVSDYAWRKLTDLQRHGAVSHGRRRKSGPGICSRCWAAAYKAEQRANKVRILADRLEDLEFMAEHGESLVGAAARLNMTRSAIEHFLVRAHRRDLLDALTRRNPTDHNGQGAAAHEARMTKGLVAA